MPSREIERILAPAVSRAASMKSETLGPILDTPIRRGRNPESEIGNMMTDILLVSVPGADVSIHNTLGGIRADLPAGPLTYGDVYEMFPFDNRLTLLHLNGAELKAILANQLQGPTRRGHIAGVRVTAGCKAGAFHMTVTDVDGAPIADDDDLLVATNDFLAIGGDNIFTPVMPAGGFATDDSAPLVRELVAAWMRQRGGHISGSDFFDGTPRRWKVDEPLPIVCVR
jgi:5'-nucleotidase